MAASGNKIGIVVSSYNASITQRLLEGALETLAQAGLGEECISVMRVPGAWEIPLGCSRLVRRQEMSGVIALGAVIRGETTHDQHINRAVSQGLMNLMMEIGKPIGFGLLTCDSLEQAIHRAGGNVGNKGQEAAQAVLAMLEALQDPHPAN
jgi:6,7-dimethyl-8-ribityllumazine synthase